MKSIKKLKLNKEAIINLDNGEMNQLKGGDSITSLAALAAGLNCPGIGVGGNDITKAGILCPGPTPNPPTDPPTPTPTQADGEASPCLNYTEVYSCADWCDNPTPEWTVDC